MKCKFVVPVKFPRHGSVRISAHSRFTAQVQLQIGPKECGRGGNPLRGRIHICGSGSSAIPRDAQTKGRPCVDPGPRRFDQGVPHPTGVQR